MTWKDFLEFAKEKGVVDEDEIFYIDTAACPEKDFLEVSFGENEKGKREVSIWT